MLVWRWHWVVSREELELCVTRDDGAALEWCEALVLIGLCPWC